MATQPNAAEIVHAGEKYLRWVRRAIPVCKGRCKHRYCVQQRAADAWILGKHFKLWASEIAALEGVPKARVIHARIRYMRKNPHLESVAAGKLLAYEGGETGRAIDGGRAWQQNLGAHDNGRGGLRDPER